jgi:hypothetical protein
MLSCGHYQHIEAGTPDVYVGDFTQTPCIHCRPAMSCQIVGIDPVPSAFTRAGMAQQRQIWESFAKAIRTDRTPAEEPGPIREEPDV